MFAITYLSSDDRDQIEKLEQKRKRIKTIEESEAIDAKIAEIRSREKNYLDCTLEEASDLRNQLWTKMMMLGSLGKHDGVQQFQMLIQQVEQHSQSLMLAVAMREMNREPPLPVEEQDVRRIPIDRVSPENRTDKAQSKQGRSRWTVGVGKSLRPRAKIGDSGE